MSFGDLQQLDFKTYGEAEDIPEVGFAVAEEGHEIDVAGAEFIECGDALDITAAIVGDSLGDTLTNEDVRTELGGEGIITTAIFGRLLSPKLMTKHGIEI